MRIKKRLLYPLAAAIFLVASATAFAIKVAPPPSRKYVSQTWVAFSSNDYYSMRLTMSTDGTGSGVLLPRNQSPEAFEVTSWDYEGYSLSLTVRFQNSEIGITGIDGEFKHHVMSYISSMLPNPDRLSAGWLPGPLELSFHQGESQVRFAAWPERDLEATLNALKNPTAQ